MSADKLQKRRVIVHLAATLQEAEETLDVWSGDRVMTPMFTYQKNSDATYSVLQVGSVQPVAKQPCLQLSA